MLKSFAFKVKDKEVHIHVKKTIDTKYRRITNPYNISYEVQIISPLISPSTIYFNDYLIDSCYVYNKMYDNLLTHFIHHHANNDKKQYRYYYGKAIGISKVITKFLHEDYIKEYHISKELVKLFRQITKKIVYPKKSYSRMRVGQINGKRRKFIKWDTSGPLVSLLQIYMHCNSNFFEKGSYIFSDLLKFERGFVKYIIMHSVIQRMKSFTEYLDFVKKAPKWLKKCKYNLMFDTQLLNAPFVPENRWEYWLLSSYFINTSDDFFGRVLLHDEVVLDRGEDVKNLFLKMYHAGKTPYDLWRKHVQLAGPYSKGKISSYYRYLNDSERLYERYKNVPNAEFRPLSGSGKNFFDIAQKNHELEAKYRHMLAEEEKKRKLQEVKELCSYEPLEKYRLKTAGELVQAGIDCHHCIGNYRDDRNSLFYRRGDVCAQVDIGTKRVVQCYDKNNKKNEASEQFERYLETNIYKALNGEVHVELARDYVLPLADYGHRLAYIA